MLPGVAEAQGPGPNYYGVAALTGSSFKGTAMNIRSNQLVVPDYSTQAAANNSWVIQNFNPFEFIEAGIAIGNITYEDCSATLLAPTYFGPASARTPTITAISVRLRR